VNGPPAASDDADSRGEEEIVYQRRERILKLVTRSFFTELTQYGIHRVAR